MIALLAVSLGFNGATLGTQILRRASPPLALKGCSPFDDSTPDGGALFKVYEAGEEDERPVVADRTKLLFAIIFTLPTLAVLLSIATYDPPSVGEVADAARSVESARRSTNSPTRCSRSAAARCNCRSAASC